MAVGSLGQRLRLLTLGLTAAFAVAALFAVARLRVLERSVTAVLSRNYRSIEAAEGMRRTVERVRLAVRDGTCASACAGLEKQFWGWLEIEHANYTEPGEPALADDVGRRARGLFASARVGHGTSVDEDVEAIGRDLDALVALNRDAMFAADRRTQTLANRLVLGTLGVVGLLALLVAAVGWKLAGALARNVDAVLDEMARTEGIIQSIDDGIVVLDVDGRVVNVNEVACAILGAEHPTIVGRRFDDLALEHPHYLRIREALRELGTRPDDRDVRAELTLFLRGRDHHYVLRPSRIRARDGSAAGTVLILQDVTHFRDQEARREELVGTLSHELGSPLTSLRLAVELIARDAVTSPEQRPLLDAAREDVERLQDLAQRLLDLARMRATGIALERRNVDLATVVPRVVGIFGPQAREKGIELEAVVPEAGVTIVGDPTKLTWAFSNLFSNALRYTPRGGRVRVDVAPDEDAVLVAVSDTGPGIPPGQRERIFERFAQAGDGGEAGAAGLGLAIVRDIVQAHGGRIRVDSACGQGSRFTVELPRG
jgi:PAS domain S-box-containing protein